ncbi:anaerobic ribonucleoside-triphosphate reductase activating protein [bacterium]|nr:anaerobic ribonucleoside-triphosphate reductase activating protein [bacterium]
MRIAGFQKCSLVDFPEKIAAVVFTPGCNMTCSYCHNRQIISLRPEGETCHDEEEIFEALARRRKFLDGVVITGGEPTLQKGLEEFIRRVRELGLAVKLDTNGTRPEVLRSLLEKDLVDYVAMDLKAPLARYPEICGDGFDPEKVRESVEVLLGSRVRYEFRTTVAPQLGEGDLMEMGEWIQGASCYVLQQYRPVEGMMSPLSAPPHPAQEIETWAECLRPMIGRVSTRGLSNGSKTEPTQAPRAAVA